MKLKSLVLAITIPFQADFQQICGEKWIDRATTAKCESNFNPNAKSFDGGRGLGQETKAWAWYIREGWVPKDSNPFQVRPAIMGIHGHESYLERKIVRWLPKEYSLRDAVGGSYNAGEKNIHTATDKAELLNLTGPAPWLTTLPSVTGKNSRYTINYIKNKRAFFAYLSRNHS